MKFMTLLKVSMALSSFIAFCAFVDNNEFIHVLASLIILCWSVNSIFNDWDTTEDIPLLTVYGGTQTVPRRISKKTNKARYYYKKIHDSIFLTENAIVKEIEKSYKINHSIKGKELIKKYCDEINETPKDKNYFKHKNITSNSNNMNKETETAYVDDSTIFFDDVVEKKKPLVMESSIIDELNTNEKKSNLPYNKKNIYDAIINEIDKNITNLGKAYKILESIVDVKINELGVIIYVKDIEIFNNESLKFINIVAAIRNKMNDNNLIVKMILKNDMTISEYYAENIK